ncbi:MAG: NFACT family protein [Myxococcales bacterium]|nr:NFACT family protein [Myxococcales bacterium]
MLGRADVAALVAALKPRVDGGQIQRIREPDDQTVVLSVRVPGQTTHLVLSAAPERARIAAAPEATVTLPEPTTLGRWLRRAARGRRLTVLEQLGDDRIVAVRFPEGALIAELGRAPALYAVDPAGRIVAASRRLPRTERELRPGRPWTPPPAPPADGAPARFTDPEAVEAALGALAPGGRDVARDRLGGRTRKRLIRLQKNVQDDVARTLDAARWRRHGELLVAQQHAAPRGATVAHVVDWYAEGAPTVEVPLDPALDAAGNAARCFQRYRKAAAGAEKAAARLAEVDAALATLDALLARELDAASLEAALVEAGLHRPPPPPPRARQREARLPFRPYTSKAGELIRVGRGGVDNHDTTFHHARGNDHWLHVRDAAGAHVIVPEPGRGREPHPETLLDAAALAIHHSKLRGEPGAEVTHTRRKHVRAVQGAPGRVTVADARALTVPDLAARIERLEPRKT